MIYFRPHIVFSIHLFILAYPTLSIKTKALDNLINLKKDVEGVAVCKLTKEDVVRHVMVQRIIEAYAKFEEKKK